MLVVGFQIIKLLKEAVDFFNEKLQHNESVAGKSNLLILVREERSWVDETHTSIRGNKTAKASVSQSFRIREITYL